MNKIIKSEHHIYMNIYYVKSLKELEYKLKENENLSKQEWDDYREDRGLYSAESIMWVYDNTENWNEFVKRFKNEYIQKLD